MLHKRWFELRYECIRDFPLSPCSVGDVLNAHEFEGKITLSEHKSIRPDLYKDHFRLLRWWEHRTTEQLLTVKYAKVVSGSNYYRNGDIVEVTNMWYNNEKLVGGKNSVCFDLKGHHFIASEIIPATYKEHDDFWEFEKSKLK